MSAYAEHYPVEEFEVVALEKTFEGPIVNPATGATSRSFILAGKVDGTVPQGDEVVQRRIMKNRILAEVVKVRRKNRKRRKVKN